MFDLSQISWLNLPQITLVAAVIDFLLVVITIPWVLQTKKEPTSALAWCLVILLLPVVGVFLFLIFGYTHVSRPLKRKRRHRARYRAKQAGPGAPATPETEVDNVGDDLGRLAVKIGAFPPAPGNRVTLYHETQQAFDEMFAAIRAARHHIHLEYYIVQPDATGKYLLDLLCQKAKEGVEIRFLFDSMGSFQLPWRALKPLMRAGAKCDAFLPLNPLRRRLQINMRNHRKITIVDGRVAFTGGINIGDEYLGKNPRFGYWRDEHLRLEGPAVAELQRVFCEDWHFAFDETVEGRAYFPDLDLAGDAVVQIVDSGPDQEHNSIRTMYIAAMHGARERLWIATPYFVPDLSILDALRLAGYRGVDVRLLCPHRPDHRIPYYAACFYWQDLLDAGVKIYQYTKGMMHSKFIIVDGKWASVSGANLDNRSLHLNFEVSCLLHTPSVVEELEAAFKQDLRNSLRLDAKVFAKRSFLVRLAENACRLLSPIL